MSLNNKTFSPPRRLLQKLVMASAVYVNILFLKARFRPRYQTVFHLLVVSALELRSNGFGGATGFAYNQFGLILDTVDVYMADMLLA